MIFMVPGFPASEDDTGCLPAVQNYVAGFAAARPDLDVHVIAFQYPYTRRRYAWKDAIVHSLAGANRTGWRRLPTWLRAARVFTRLCREIDVKVLHTFWLTECTRVGQWLSKRSGVRHVASIGGQDATRSNHYLGRLDLGAPVITAGSRFAADIFNDHAGGPRARVIPLGLDTAHLETIPSPASRDIDIIGVGSLIPLKRYGEFVDIVATLTQEFPALQASIIGGGAEHDDLVDRIARRGLGANITLTGQLDRDEAIRRMLRSRVFLHTSQYESQAYVFLEALFAGLDLVCYDVGHTGTSDRVHLCRSPQELTAACRRLLRAPREPIRQPVTSVADTVRSFEEIYDV